MAACRQPGLLALFPMYAIQSADHKNPTLEPNRKRIGLHIVDMAIRASWGHMEPPFWEEEEVVGGQRWHH